MFHMWDTQDCTFPSPKTCRNYKLPSAHNLERIMLCHLNYSSFVIKLESNFIIKKVVILLCDRPGQIREGDTCFKLIFKSSLELKVTVAETIMAEIQHSSSEV